MTEQSLQSKNKFSLIKEECQLEDARDLLMTLVAGTIHYYNLNNLRSWERRGDKDNSSEKRIKELTQLQGTILEKLKDLDGENLSIEINAIVKVTAKKK